MRDVHGWTKKRPRHLFGDVTHRIPELVRTKCQNIANDTMHQLKRLIDMAQDGEGSSEELKDQEEDLGQNMFL